MCSAEEINSYRFETIVNADRVVIFGWTVPLNIVVVWNIPLYHVNARITAAQSWYYNAWDRSLSDKEGLFEQKSWSGLILTGWSVCGCVDAMILLCNVCVWDMLRNVNVIWNRRNVVLSVRVLLKPHVAVRSYGLVFVLWEKFREQLWEDLKWNRLWSSCETYFVLLHYITQQWGSMHKQHVWVIFHCKKKKGLAWR